MAGSVAEDGFVAAHRALLSDGDIQFGLPRFTPDPPPPGWLRAVGRWLERIFQPVGRLLRWIGAHMPDAPFARIFLWTVLAAMAAGLAWMLWQQLRGRRWRRRRALSPPAADVTNAVQPPPVRAWLEEADALAAAGRFAEAAHHLLMRSVEELNARRPASVRPASTARELAHAAGIPAAARRPFAALTTVVERSLFGGRAVDAADWAACRAGHDLFVAHEAWAG